MRTRVSSSVRTSIVEPLGTPEERALLQASLADSYAWSCQGQLLCAYIFGDDVFAVVLFQGLEIYVKIDTRKEWIVTASIESKDPERVQPILDSFMNVIRK